MDCILDDSALLGQLQTQALQPFGDQALRARHRAQPQFTDAFHEIRRSGEWWSYPLPGTDLAKRLAKSSEPVAPQPPKGWATAKPDELRHHVVPLADEAAIQFFNGAVPGGHTALSIAIPRRKIVERLSAAFDNADASGRSVVTLLLAAGCEGKPTALLQSAYEVATGKAGWQILRRVDDAEPLKPAEILPVLSDRFRWLVVVDEADRTTSLSQGRLTLRMK